MKEALKKINLSLLGAGGLVLGGYFLISKISSYLAQKEEISQFKFIEANVKELNHHLNSNNLSDFINISDIYQKFVEYLSMISPEQQLALSHIFLIISIISCLNSILAILFGEQIIAYFQLEKKHPKLSKWIEYRRKFQTYFLILNFTLVFFFLFFLLLLNLVAFIL